MYLTLSSPFGVENNVHEYLTKRTGLFAYWHTNGYTIICCLLMVTYVHLWQRSRCPQQPKIYCSEAPGTILAMFRHIQNILKIANDWILSDIQTGGLHLVYRLRIGANLTWHAWVFTLSWPEFAETSRWLPKTFWRLQNIAENVRRCSEDVWALPKLLYKTTTIFRALISLEHKKGYKVIIYHLFGLNFHNLSCVTQH